MDLNDTCSNVKVYQIKYQNKTNCIFFKISNGWVSFVLFWMPQKDRTRFVTLCTLFIWPLGLRVVTPNSDCLVVWLEANSLTTDQNSTKYNVDSVSFLETTRFCCFKYCSRGVIWTAMYFTTNGLFGIYYCCSNHTMWTVTLNPTQPVCCHKKSRSQSYPVVIPVPSLEITFKICPVYVASLDLFSSV